MGLGVAIRAFFKSLFDADVSARVEQALLGKTPALPPAAPAPAPKPIAPTRSEALSLLAVLQREGRLVDFLKENLSGYTDAQIGAAVRDVHRDCAAVLDRLFALRPVRNEAEGASLEIPAGFDAGRVRLTGNVAGGGPYRGSLRHAGWEATRCEVPAWSGSAEAAKVIAPAEVEV